MFFPDKEARRKQLFSMMHHVEVNIEFCPNILQSYQIFNAVASISLGTAFSICPFICS
jgi:hypothetical protein